MAFEDFLEHDLAPPNHRRPNSTHIDGTLVPVEEPSTASLPNTLASKIIGKTEETCSFRRSLSSAIVCAIIHILHRGVTSRHGRRDQCRHGFGWEHVRYWAPSCADLPKITTLMALSPLPFGGGGFSDHL